MNQELARVSSVMGTPVTNSISQHLDGQRMKEKILRKVEALELECKEEMSELGLPLVFRRFKEEVEKSFVCSRRSLTLKKIKVLSKIHFVVHPKKQTRVRFQEGDVTKENL